MPDLHNKAERGEILFGTIDTLIIWSLTGGTKGGVHITSFSNVLILLLLIILETLEWDDEILRVLGIPRSILQVVRPSL